MELPTITEQDLKTFHLKHFPAASLPQSFASAQDRDQELEDELGYYPDGTKRTLTDDQIAMFRHSEIQQLLKTLRSLTLAWLSVCGFRSTEASSLFTAARF